MTFIFQTEGGFPVIAPNISISNGLLQVREKVRLVAQLGLEIEEHQERLKILDEHLKSVQMELVHTQSLVDVKNKEIESEEHLKQVAER